jgi:hypothetical protein
MFNSLSYLQPQLVVFGNSNYPFYIPQSNISSILMPLPMPTLIPQPFILQNSFHLNAPQMLQSNHLVSNLVQQNQEINLSFKFTFFEILANQFPKVLKDYILQIIQSNNFSKVNFGKSVREIKRTKSNLLIQFIQEYSDIFYNLLNEETCVCLVMKVFQQYVKVVNQKKVRIQNFIQLYSIVSSQFRTNSQLAFLKSELMIVSSISLIAIKQILSVSL